MFGLGMGEIVVILIVALLVLGPTQLPDAAKSLGKAIRQLRRHTRDLQDTIDKDEAIGGTVRELKSALRGDEYHEPFVPRRTFPETEKPVAQEPEGPSPEPRLAAAPSPSPASETVTPPAIAVAPAPVQKKPEHG